MERSLGLPLLSATGPRTLTRKLQHVQAAEDLKKPTQITQYSPPENVRARTRVLLRHVDREDVARIWPRFRELLRAADGSMLDAALR